VDHLLEAQHDAHDALNKNESIERELQIRIESLKQSLAESMEKEERTRYELEAEVNFKTCFSHNSMYEM
jgi:hypothetical protein